MAAMGGGRLLLVLALLQVALGDGASSEQACTVLISSTVRTWSMANVRSDGKTVIEGCEELWNDMT